MNRLYALQLTYRMRLMAPRFICSKGWQLNANTSVPSATGIRPRKSLKTSPKITLVQNQSMSVTSLGDAQKLAKRRDLHLVLVQEFDSKTKRPVYKLVTSAEMISVELEEAKLKKKPIIDKDKAALKKSEKSLTIGARISEHDLASRLKNISKWLAKRHEVRVLIECSNHADMSSGEKIVKSIEQSIKVPEVIGKIVQKHTTGAVIKFSILPVVTAAGEASCTTQA